MVRAKLITNFRSYFSRRYIHLIGTQKILRNDFVEKSLVSFIINVIRDENFICGPADYSKFYLTILALSHGNPFRFFTDAVWHKLLEYLPRLNVYDNMFVSLILRVAYDRFKKRRQDLAKFLHYHVSTSIRPIIRFLLNAG